MKTIAYYRELYSSGKTVTEVMLDLWELIDADDDPGIFIEKFSWEQIESQIRDSGPLLGIPFVIKDNIDLAGFPTTAGCPDYSYQPDETAPVVSALQNAGAICFGKTNLDQFATGLVGVRTPYPAPKNTFDPDYLPGGSSCGSAVAVAKNLVAFSLGTDTAGSGRVPAAFNELIGLKPTRGYLSTRGVVDACKSLDCVSIFAHTCTDADEVLKVAAVPDPEEAWSRPAPKNWPRLAPEFTFGVPNSEHLDYFGWDEAATLFEDAAQRLEAIGGTRVEIDLTPFITAAKLLYEGPWVTERFVAIRDFLKSSPDSIFPVTRTIIEGGEAPLASSLFEAQYRLADCKRLANQEMATVDCVLVPTTPRNYTVAELEADPIKVNSIIGTYTNFMNLLDYSAVALPAGRFQGTLPWGITLFAEPGHDRALLEIGAKYTETQSPEGDWDEVLVAVCGAHLSGMPLNHQLTSRGGYLAFTTTTSSDYRMYQVPAGDGLPERPALARSNEGAAIELEVWALTSQAFGEFTSNIPAPLGVGKVQLADGSSVSGFIAEPMATEDTRDLTEFGGWRAYQASKETS